MGAVGTLVSNLVDFAVPAGQVDNVTDADSIALLGVAITGADSSNGAWWISTNNGASWSALGAVSDASARLLAADGSDAHLLPAQCRLQRHAKQRDHLPRLGPHQRQQRR